MHTDLYIICHYHCVPFWGNLPLYVLKCITLVPSNKQFGCFQHLLLTKISVVCMPLYTSDNVLCEYIDRVNLQH